MFVESASKGRFEMKSQESSRDLISRHFDFYECSYSRFYYEGVGKCGSNFYQRRIRAAIPPDSSGIVLELGSRNFELTKVVSSRINTAHLVLGLDLQAPQYGTENRDSHTELPLRALMANVENIPLANSTVDLVFHGCFLHHLERPLNALLEIRRVMRVGGLIIYYLPCHPGLLIRLWQRLFTQRHLTRVARESNFPEFRPQFIEAAIHKGNYLGIRELIRMVHRNDEVKSSSFPFRIPSWNLKAFDLVVVRKCDVVAADTKSCS